MPELNLPDEKKEIDSLVMDALIKCENEKCLQLSTGHDIKRNDGRCPFCGRLMEVRI